MPEVANSPKTDSTRVITTVLALALQAVSAKAVTLLALGMTFGLFCWSMWAHSWISVATATAFALLVFLPVFLKGAAQNARENG